MQNYLKPLSNRIILKLENLPVKRTPSGIVYDESLFKKRYRYGHVFAITDKDSEKLGIKFADRVIFEIEYAEPITYKSVKDRQYIPLILVCVKPEGIMAKAPEEFSVLDF